MGLPAFSCVCFVGCGGADYLLSTSFLFAGNFPFQSAACEITLPDLADCLHSGYRVKLRPGAKPLPLYETLFFLIYEMY